LTRALVPATGAEGVGDARCEVAAEQQRLHLLERTLHRGDLEEDVHAVGVVADHPLETLDLPFDAAQSAQRLRLGGVVQHPGTLRGYSQATRAACQTIGPGLRDRRARAVARNSSP